MKIATAEKGNINSQFVISSMYNREKNFRQAYSWFEVARMSGLKTNLSNQNYQKKLAAKLSPLELEEAKLEAERIFSRIMLLKLQRKQKLLRKAKAGKRTAINKFLAAYLKKGDFQSANILTKVMNLCKISLNKSNLECLKRLKLEEQELTEN